MFRRACVSAAAFLFTANLSYSTGLPPLTSELKDFEYSSNPLFTGYSPAGAVVTLSTGSVLLYGTPALSGGPDSKLELFDILNADVCYSLSCPSSTALYPQPNHVFTAGGLSFAPNSIVPGTGVATVNTDFTLNGALFHGVGGPATGEVIHAAGLPTIFTGIDAGGASSYVYFLNQDGTYSATLHVLRNTTGGGSILGVVLDPPGTLTLDILGFSNLDPNSFVTPPIPEPATWQFGVLMLIGAGVAGSLNRTSRASFISRARPGDGSKRCSNWR